MSVCVLGDPLPHVTNTIIKRMGGGGVIVVLNRRMRQYRLMSGAGMLASPENNNVDQ